MQQLKTHRSGGPKHITEKGGEKRQEKDLNGGRRRGGLKTNGKRR